MACVTVVGEVCGRGRASGEHEREDSVREQLPFWVHIGLLPPIIFFRVVLPLFTIASCITAGSPCSDNNDEMSSQSIKIRVWYALGLSKFRDLDRLILRQ